jgi:hypothetical protein
MEKVKLTVRSKKMESTKEKMEVVEPTQNKPFKLTQKRVVIASLLFLFGFYCTAKMYSDVVLSFAGLDYSYQINDSKSFNVLIMATIFGTLLTLFSVFSIVLDDMTSKSKKIAIATISLFVIMQIFYQVMFFNTEKVNEVNKGYKELSKYLQISSHQDYSKSDLYKQISADKLAGDESKLKEYIKDKENLLSIPNTLLTGLISVNEITKQPESKAKFNEIYKDKFVTRRELDEYKQLIANIEENKTLPESLKEIVTTINVFGQKTTIRQ